MILPIPIRIYWQRFLGAQDAICEGISEFRKSSFLDDYDRLFKKEAFGNHVLKERVFTDVGKVFNSTFADFTCLDQRFNGYFVEDEGDELEYNAKQDIEEAQDISAEAVSWDDGIELPSDSSSEEETASSTDTDTSSSTSSDSSENTTDTSSSKAETSGSSVSESASSSSSENTSTTSTSTNNSGGGTSTTTASASNTGAATSTTANSSSSSSSTNSSSSTTNTTATNSTNTTKASSSENATTETTTTSSTTNTSEKTETALQSAAKTAKTKEAASSRISQLKDVISNLYAGQKSSTSENTLKEAVTDMVVNSAINSLLNSNSSSEKKTEKSSSTKETTEATTQESQTLTESASDDKKKELTESVNKKLEDKALVSALEDEIVKVIVQENNKVQNLFNSATGKTTTSQDKRFCSSFTKKILTGDPEAIAKFVKNNKAKIHTYAQKDNAKGTWLEKVDKASDGTSIEIMEPINELITQTSKSLTKVTKVKNLARKKLSEKFITPAQKSLSGSIMRRFSSLKSTVVNPFTQLYNSIQNTTNFVTQSGDKMRSNLQESTKWGPKCLFRLTVNHQSRN